MLDPPKPTITIFKTEIVGALIIEIANAQIRVARPWKIVKPKRLIGFTIFSEGTRD